MNTGEFQTIKISETSTSKPIAPIFQIKNENCSKNLERLLQIQDDEYSYTSNKKIMHRTNRYKQFEECQIKRAVNVIKN